MEKSIIGGQTNCLTDSQGQRTTALRERQFYKDGDRSQGQISPRSSVGALTEADYWVYQVLDVHCSRMVEKGSNHGLQSTVVSKFLSTW